MVTVVRKFYSFRDMPHIAGANITRHVPRSGSPGRTNSVQYNSYWDRHPVRVSTPRNQLFATLAMTVLIR